MSQPDPSSDIAARSPMMGRGERLALEEIGRTEIKQLHAVVFVGVFLVMFVGVLLWDMPMLRSLRGPVGFGGSAGEAESATDFPMASMLPKWSHGLFATNRRLLEWIKATENRLDEQSPFARTLQPRMQVALAACGEGGKEVMVGRDGWLFYRPSFRMLTRHAESATVAGPRSARSDPTMGFPAALSAVTQFSAALKRRGIQLVVVPVWPKLSVQPEHLGGPAYRVDDVLKLAGFGAWRAAVEQTGAVVFDPAASLLAAKAAHAGAAYLKTDSHWNPGAMQACAGDLARYLTERGLAEPGTLKATLSTRVVTNQGDLARMLQLPTNAAQFPPEAVEIAEVRGQQGTRWLSERSAPVLLLGDSFCNIFSMASMGWGQDAGFSEHLGAALGRPVDAILRNGDGASATRRLLARELASGKDRLADKRVVVWAFAASQLTEGRWLDFSYDLGAPPPTDGTFVELADEQSSVVSATVLEMGAVPHPSSTVYKEYVDYLVLDDIKWHSGAAITGSQALVYGLVMKDHQWTAAASLRPGQRIRATLKSWSSVEEEFGRHERREPPDQLLLQPVNWLADFSSEDSP
jgi:alginate O-acetyltransferase complex protein AlgJ